MSKTPCDGCVYWRRIQGGDQGTGARACHYYLDTGITRTSLGALGAGCQLKRKKSTRKRNLKFPVEACEKREKLEIGKRAVDWDLLWRESG